MPRRGPPRKEMNDGKRKRLAVQRLMQDKALTSELIRIYSNNAEIRESKRKLALAVGNSRPSSATKSSAAMPHRLLATKRLKNSALVIQPVE